MGQLRDHTRLGDLGLRRRSRNGGAHPVVVVVAHFRGLVGRDADAAAVRHNIRVILTVDSQVSPIRRLVPPVHNGIKLPVHNGIDQPLGIIGDVRRNVPGEPDPSVTCWLLTYSSYPRVRDDESVYLSRLTGGAVDRQGPVQWVGFRNFDFMRPLYVNVPHFISTAVI